MATSPPGAEITELDLPDVRGEDGDSSAAVCLLAVCASFHVEPRGGGAFETLLERAGEGAATAGDIVAAAQDLGLSASAGPLTLDQLAAKIGAGMPVIADLDGTGRYAVFYGLATAGLLVMDPVNGHDVLPLDAWPGDGIVLDLPGAERQTEYLERTLHPHEALAHHYANVFNALHDEGEQVPHWELNGAHEDLAGTDWHVDLGHDGTWRPLHHEDMQRVYLWPAVEKARRRVDAPGQGHLWNKELHPRGGKPENKGEFSEKPGGSGEPAEPLGAPKKPPVKREAGSYTKADLDAMPEEGRRQLANELGLSRALKGKNLYSNLLIRAAMEGAPARHLPEAASAASPSPHESEPAQKADPSGVILKEFQELLREKYGNTGMVPIHEVRQRIAERLGTKAARHDVFDAQLHRLRQEDRLRMVPISFLGDATPEQLNDSIPGVNETLFYLEKGNGAAAPREPMKPDPVAPPQPLAPADHSGVILKEFQELLREKYGNTGMVPIHEVRQRIAERLGTKAARHDVFDAQLHRLRQEDRLRMVPISFLGDATPEQLNDSIPGVNETLFYLEPAQDEYSIKKSHAVEVAKARRGKEAPGQMGLFGAGGYAERAEKEPETPAAPVEAAAVLEGTHHAPKGGVTLAGEYFLGGRFIPNEAKQEATPAEKQELIAKEEASVKGAAAQVVEHPKAAAQAQVTRERKLEELEEAARQVGQLQAQVKQQSMTYQRTMKEVVASYYGLPFEAVDLPFEQWMALRHRYENDIQASKAASSVEQAKQEAPSAPAITHQEPAGPTPGYEEPEKPVEAALVAKKPWQMSPDEYRAMRAEVTGRAPRNWRDDYRRILQGAATSGQDVSREKLVEAGSRLKVLESGDLAKESLVEHQLDSIPPAPDDRERGQGLDEIVRLRALDGEIYATVTRPYSIDSGGRRYWKFRILSKPSVKTPQAQSLQAALPEQEDLINRDSEPLGRWARAETDRAKKIFGDFQPPVPPAAVAEPAVAAEPESPPVTAGDLLARGAGALDLAAIGRLNSDIKDLDMERVMSRGLAGNPELNARLDALKNERDRLAGVKPGESVNELEMQALTDKKGLQKAKFTGIDANGHKWVNGEQVAIGEGETPAEQPTPVDVPAPAGENVSEQPVPTEEPHVEQPAASQPEPVVEPQPGPGGVPEPERGGDTGGGVSGDAGGERPRSAGPRIVTARPEHTKAGDPGLVPESVRGHLNETQQLDAGLAIDAMTKHGGFLTASGTGTGKTRVQLAVAQHFIGQGRKVVIVSPAEVIKPDWKKGSMSGSFAADSATMGVPVKLTKGDAEIAPGAAHITTYNELNKLKDQIDKNTVVIFDESHFMKNRESAWFKHGAEIMDRAAATMYATATPGDKPLHIAHLARAGVFGNIGKTETYQKLGMELVDQHVGGGRYQRVWRIDPKVGYKEAGRRVSGLFDQMTKDGLMVKRELAMDHVHFQADRVTFSDEEHEAVRKAYQQKLDETRSQAFPNGNKAVALMTARMFQEPLKIPATVDMVKEEIAAGRSPIVFLGRVNDITDEDAEEGEDKISFGTAGKLKEALIAAGVPAESIGELHGAATKTPDAKKKAMERFQSGKTSIMIATVQSGGTGINLDDTTGERPRTVIMMTPPFTANDMAQAIGRVHRLNTKSDSRVRGVLVDTHIDDWNAGILENKFRTLGAVVGGESTRGQAAYKPPEAEGLEEEDKEPFEWGESLHSQPKFQRNTPFAHNDIIGRFGGKRVNQSGEWTTQFPSEAHYERYRQHVAPKPPIPPTALAPVAASSPPVASQEQAAPVPMSTARKEAIHQGLRQLHATNQDRAREQNGVGFNQMDSDFGGKLAESPTLTDRQAEAAARMLGKYKRQLGEDLHGKITTPEKPEGTSPVPTATATPVSPPPPPSAPPPPPPPPPSASVSIKRMQTKRGMRSVHSFAPTESFWQARDAGKVPSNVTLYKHRDGRYEASVWGDNDEEIHATLAELQKRGVRLQTSLVQLGKPLLLPVVLRAWRGCRVCPLAAAVSLKEEVLTVDEPEPLTVGALRKIDAKPGDTLLGALLMRAAMLLWITYRDRGTAEERAVLTRLVDELAAASRELDPPEPVKLGAEIMDRAAATMYATATPEEFEKFDDSPNDIEVTATKIRDHVLKTFGVPNVIDGRAFTDGVLESLDDARGDARDAEVAPPAGDSDVAALAEAGERPADKPCEPERKIAFREWL